MPHQNHHSDSDETDSDGDEVTMGGYTDLPPEQRPGYKPPASHASGVQYAQPIQPTFTPYPQWGYNAPTSAPQVATSAPKSATASGAGYRYADIKEIKYTAKPVVEPKPPPRIAHTRVPSVTKVPNVRMPQPGAGFPGYGQEGQPQYPQGIPPPPANFPGGIPPPPAGHPPGQFSDLPPPPPQPSKIPSGAVIREVKPPPSPSLRPHANTINGGRPNLRAPSPSGLGSRMNRLSVSGDRPDIHTIAPGGRPPASPLLEAYKGTWQQMSPMPSPIMMGRRYEDDDLDDLAPLEPRNSRTSVHRTSIARHSPSPPFKEKKKKKKSVTIYNEQAESDARDIASELSRSNPDFKVLVEILPTLSHDQILELRTEYKRVCKIQGRGINIAKHIKLKTTGNFAKICYVTALGRWESEGYWANFWYQSNSARRELVIEALMGRTNAEIRNIKDSFKDKRYNDDLVRCMDKELKADKFRVGVLMALDEQRQEENDVWPIEYRNRDADALYSALKRREGGETAILEIVVMRSDGHLREVLKTYERKYRGNFAKDCLKRSGNLVGEIVAHILNGVINKPARDAMLLHHALLDLAPSEKPNGPSPRTSKTDVHASKSDKKDRYELLISRLVRLHWDRLHFMRVEKEYKEKYGSFLEHDVEDYVKGEDFREFCLNMCDSAK